MRRLAIILLWGCAACAQVVGGSGSGSGNATSLQGNAVASTIPTSGNCLVFTTIWGPGSCSGTASTNWSALVSGTNTTGTFLIGAGASLGTTSTGTISASQLNGGAVPASAVVLGSNVSSQPVAATTTGSGSVVLATSPALVAPSLGTPSAVTLTNATGLPCAALPALTGDATTSAGSCVTTVAHVNGAAVPASAPFLTSNSSSQLTAGSILGTANGGTGASSLAGASIPVQTGTITTGHCVEWASGTAIEDAGSACGSGGIAVHKLDETNYAQTLPSTPVVASPTAGEYRVSCWEEVVQAASTSSVLPYLYVSYTDGAGITENQPCTGTSTSNTVGTYTNAYNAATTGTQIDVSAAAAITAYSSSYASSGATPMLYNIHIVVTGPY